MKKWCKKATASVVALGCMTLLAQTGVGEAAKKKTPEKLPSAPIILEGDELHYNDKSGEVWVRGHVVVEQRQDKVETELLRGNAKSQDVWVDNRLTFTETGVARLEGNKLAYNYGRRTGSIGKVYGKIEQDYVGGERAEIFPDHYVVYDGFITRCDAKKPDYKMTAQRIEVWPGKKMVAYEVKLWIKNWIIYRVDKLERVIGSDTQSSVFPRIGHNSADGLHLTQHLERPLSEETSLFADVQWMSKPDRHFRPYYGVKHRAERYTAAINMGDISDNDDFWIKKKPELQVHMNPVDLGAHVYYTADAAYGKWSDDEKESWHQDYSLYFARKPVALTKTLIWSSGIGAGVTRESYGDSTTKRFRFNTLLKKELSDQWRGWLGYNYLSNNDSIFNYGRVEVRRELVAGFGYRVDRLNELRYRLSYDVENSRAYDRDITWAHKMHCWQLDVTYRVDRGEVRWGVGAVEW